MRASLGWRCDSFAASMDTIAELCESSEELCHLIETINKLTSMCSVARLDCYHLLMERANSLIERDRSSGGKIMASSSGGRGEEKMGELRERGGEVRERGGEVRDRGGEVRERGGEVRERGGEVRDRGGEVRERGGEVRATLRSRMLHKIYELRTRSFNSTFIEPQELYWRLHNQTTEMNDTRVHGANLFRACIMSVLGVMGDRLPYFPDGCHSGNPFWEVECFKDTLHSYWVSKGIDPYGGVRCIGRAQRVRIGTGTAKPFHTPKPHYPMGERCRPKVNVFMGRNALEMSNNLLQSSSSHTGTSKVVGDTHDMIGEGAISLSSVLRVFIAQFSTDSNLPIAMVNELTNEHNIHLTAVLVGKERGDVFLFLWDMGDDDDDAHLGITEPKVNKVNLIHTLTLLGLSNTSS
eukprot:GHVN01050580.1.p1 GENE.GHVN01050580.1~~GHVN01050580.1.p1  ORF type:complete len:409 (+),score=129.85 GHVN01050580.1:642-1868(+)